MSKPLRICHLTLAADPGGLSKYIIDLVSAMRTLGHECVVLGDRGAWSDSFAAAQIEYHTIPLKRGLVGLARSWMTARRLLETRGFDILHTHYRRATLLGRMLQTSRRPPLLYTLHLSHINVTGFRRYFTDFGDHTHVASVDALEWLTGTGGVPSSRATLIPHGVDLAHYQPPPAIQRFEARNRLGLGADDRVALFVGRLEHPKNEHWLLDVDDRAVARGLDRKILLVGEGPHEQALRERVRREGRAGRVVLFGRADPRPFYHAADALLLPSSREGFSLVCAEAMACGIPVLRTCTSGTSELIVDKVTGVSTPIDRDAFADAAVEFLADLDRLRAMGRAAREHVATHFGFDRQVTRTIELYHRLVARR